MYVTGRLVHLCFLPLPVSGVWFNKTGFYCLFRTLMIQVFVPILLTAESPVLLESQVAPLSSSTGCYHLLISIPKAS